MKRTLVLAAALVLGACGTEDSEACDPATVDASTARIAQILGSACLSCHSVQSAGATRKGATLGVDFDTAADMSLWRDRIAARILDGTMPPTGSVTDDERCAIVGWQASAR